VRGITSSRSVRQHVARHARLKLVAKELEAVLIQWAGRWRESAAGLAGTSRRQRTSAGNSTQVIVMLDRRKEHVLVKDMCSPVTDTSRAHGIASRDLFLEAVRLMPWNTEVLQIPERALRPALRCGE
jgi:hypothetical protein